MTRYKFGIISLTYTSVGLYSFRGSNCVILILPPFSMEFFSERKEFAPVGKKSFISGRLDILRAHRKTASKCRDTYNFRDFNYKGAFQKRATIVIRHHVINGSFRRGKR